MNIFIVVYMFDMFISVNEFSDSFFEVFNIIIFRYCGIVSSTYSLMKMNIIVVVVLFE